jgi:hypothetical protein
MYNQVATTQVEQEPPLILNTNTALVSSTYAGILFKFSIPALNNPTSYKFLTNPFGSLMTFTNSGVISGIASTPGVYNIPFEVSNNVGTTQYSMSITVKKIPYYTPSNNIYFGFESYDIGDVNNWWLDYNLIVPAEKLPAKENNVIIVNNVGSNIHNINLYTNTITLTSNVTIDDLNTGSVYTNTLNSVDGSIYGGIWNITNVANIGYFETPITAAIINSYKAFGGTSQVSVAHNFLNGSGLGTGGAGEVNGNAYFYGGNCDGTVYGDAHFYNGASLINGSTITGTAYFSGGNCGGNVNGNVYFYDGSTVSSGVTLCDPNGSPGGDNGRVDFYPGSDEGSGVLITGDAYFHSPKTYNGLNTIYGNIYYV